MFVKLLCLIAAPTAALALSLSASSAGAASSSKTLPDDVHVEAALPKALQIHSSTHGFQSPVYTAKQEAKILAGYADVDPKHEIPTQLLKDALLYYHANAASIPNQSYLSVIDYSKYSGQKRFFIINMQNGLVWSTRVAHGKGSDPSHTGHAIHFSNRSGSNMTSLGFFLTAEVYSGTHGHALRLDGLSTSNSLARSREIVLHGATYVEDARINQGRSLGCPAVPMSERDEIIAWVKGGSLIYAGYDGHAPALTRGQP